MKLAPRRHAAIGIAIFALNGAAIHARVTTSISIAVDRNAQVAVADPVDEKRVETPQTKQTNLRDQIVRLLPDGIALKSATQDGTTVTLVVHVQSGARVSALMRKIESSSWLQQPELIEIKSVRSEGNPDWRIAEATLKAQVK